MTSVLAHHRIDSTSPNVKPLLLLLHQSRGDVSGISAHLEQDAFRVLRATHDPSAVELARRCRPDVVVLQVDPSDAGLRSMDQILNDVSAPVIVMAPSQDADPVRALEHGADDYVVEPAAPPEITARARAAVRRSQRESSQRVRRVGALELDGEARHAQVHGRRLPLTPVEYTVLEFLARTPGQVVTHQALMQATSAGEAEGTTGLGQRIQRLRYKLAGARVSGPFITAVRGVGYRLDT